MSRSSQSQEKPSRRRPKQLRSRQTVEAVLDAVVRILKREGIDAVTTNRIAEVAGVSIGSVYQYFPDKRAIYAALHDRHVEEIGRLIERTLVEEASASFESFVRALVNALVDAHGSDPDLHHALSQAPHSGEGARALETRLRGVFRLAITSRSKEKRTAADLDRILFVLPPMVESLAHGAATHRPARLSLTRRKRGSGASGAGVSAFLAGGGAHRVGGPTMFCVEGVAPFDEIGELLRELVVRPNFAHGGAEANELFRDGQDRLQHYGHRDVGVRQRIEQIRLVFKHISRCLELGANRDLARFEIVRDVVFVPQKIHRRARRHAERRAKRRGKKREPLGLRAGDGAHARNHPNACGSQCAFAAIVPRRDRGGMSVGKKFCAVHRCARPRARWRTNRGTCRCHSRALEHSRDREMF